ncbi:TdcF protein [Williamsoniiplasma somnilux]|uniref:TdcF protein n=1 Tax=Williamsoniiplasma somnilux TaxID=215578 RepID=A0A2K8NY43_9MOLU|nr:Rid family detoxifying hydrolase [Williamsoniiplasma somnilux]ATZ18707.1 TdcF protein [Williamsoniiplasma somnilux]
MKNKIIFSPEAPAAIGPYSQAILDQNNTIYISGQLPIDNKIGKIVSDNISDQTLQCLKNLEYILKSAGKNLENVIKVTVLLTDINEFQEMNKIYENFFKEVKPARSAYQVVALPRGAKIEIELVAQ